MKIYRVQRVDEYSGRDFKHISRERFFRRKKDAAKYQMELAREWDGRGSEWRSRWVPLDVIEVLD